MKTVAFLGLALCLGGLVAAQSTVVHGATPVTTYHYDISRSGWNNQETTLTAASFPTNFGLLVSNTTFDDLIDAQPLVVPGLTITGGTHDVVYVETQSNTVYAVDATTGAILLSRNLGPPVPAPAGCPSIPEVGITSTPVIDLGSQQIFVMAYVNGATVPSYQLHALSLTTLADNPNSPVTVAASHALTNGSNYTFNAAVQQQRPGLLGMNGTIYAAFGSFCDFDASLSRGWLLGWTASNLAPIATNRLNDSQATSPTNWFFTSIWMSGYGLAGGTDVASGGGPRIMFSTGNSDCNIYVNPIQCPSTSTYDGVTNIQESVVKTDTTATNILGIFSPPPAVVLAMDAQDLDMGAGGVMMLPPQNGNIPDLAVAAGKNGRLMLLNRDNMTAPVELAPIGIMLVRTLLLYRTRQRSTHRHQPGQRVNDLAAAPIARASSGRGGEREHSGQLSRSRVLHHGFVERRPTRKRHYLGSRTSHHVDDPGVVRVCGDCVDGNLQAIVFRTGRDLARHISQRQRCTGCRQRKGVCCLLQNARDFRRPHQHLIYVIRRSCGIGRAIANRAADSFAQQPARCDRGADRGHRIDAHAPGARRGERTGRCFPGLKEPANLGSANHWPRVHHHRLIDKRDRRAYRDVGHPRKIGIEQFMAG